MVDVLWVNCLFFGNSIAKINNSLIISNTMVYKNTLTYTFDANIVKNLDI